MDVRCPKCQSEYDLDDARVTDDGVTVKCSECQHVFRVKKKSLVMTLPVRDEAPVEASSLPPAPAPAPREWRVRQADGAVSLCRELTTLQRWIVEGKVRRDDEISLTGDAWKRLGDIPELASFFQVVDDAERGRALAASRERQGSSGPEVPPPPPPPSVPPPPRATETFREPAFVGPGPGAPAGEPPLAMLKETIRGPAFSVPLPPPRARGKSSGRLQAPVDLPDDDELARSLKGGGSGKWVALVLGGLLVGGSAGYYFGFYEPEQQAKAEAARLAAEREAAARGDAGPGPDVVLARVSGAEAADAAVAPEVALVGEKASPEGAKMGADAGAAALSDAGQPGPEAIGSVPTVGTAPQPVEEKATPGGPAAAPAARTYDAYLQRADALREAEKFSQALSFYGKAADLKPDRVEPIVGRGSALFDLGQLLQAEASFEQALRLNGKYGPAILGMAEVLKAQGKTARAATFYQRYLDEHPTGSEANVARNALERLK
ncbi:MAG: zinc-ribbon domain-containing protein [Myxococcaceae bacterium]|nr:zinc-ribbon domain-containing protein [Myxococcaceae bacterium]